jgi:hypothetical protein
MTKLRGKVARKLTLAVMVLLVAYAVWIALWARQGEGLAAVRLGIDRCHHCGMIVSDIRYSVSILDRDEEGHAVSRHFDDPGCYQEFAREHPGRSFAGIAHDYRSGQAMPIESARFERRAVETPMGSGVVAVQAGAPR